ncbi:hypothetical protein BC829DRAFT_387871, partial [Chytridium lagenaria]
MDRGYQRIPSEPRSCSPLLTLQITYSILFVAALILLPGIILATALALATSRFIAYSGFILWGIFYLAFSVLTVLVWIEPKRAWRFLAIPVPFALTHIIFMNFLWIPNTLDATEITHYAASIIAVQIVYTVLFITSIVFCPGVYTATVMTSATSSFICTSGLILWSLFYVSFVTLTVLVWIFPLNILAWLPLPLLFGLSHIFLMWFCWIDDDSDGPEQHSREPQGPVSNA